VGYLGAAYLEWHLSLLQQRLLNEHDKEENATVVDTSTASLVDHLLHQALRTVDRAIVTAELETN